MNIQAELEALYQQNKQRSGSLSERLNAMDSYSSQVDPAVRAQMLDFSNRPEGHNPLGDIASAIEFSERSRSYRSAADQDLARTQSEGLNLLSQLDAISQRGGSGDGLQEKLMMKGIETGALSIEMDPETGKLRVTQGKGKGAKTADQAKAEGDLRKEFDARTKESGFKDVQSSYNKIKSTKATGAGDMSLIFAYMKLLDPSSTVREGEYATAQNVGSVPDNVVQSYNKALKGEKLKDNVRQDFRNEAAAIYNQYVDRQMTLNRFYDQQAASQGLDHRSVTGGVGRVPKAETVSPSQSKSLVDKYWGGK